MYFLRNGLHSPLLASLFSVLGALAAFGIGNMVQANSVSSAVSETFGIPAHLSGFIMAFVCGLVILGGIRRIALVSSAIVPFMALFYFTGGLLVLFIFREQIPSAFLTIVSGAFRSGLRRVCQRNNPSVWRIVCAGYLPTRRVWKRVYCPCRRQNGPPFTAGMGGAGGFCDTHIIYAVLRWSCGYRSLANGSGQAAMTAWAFSRGLPEK